MQKKIVYQTLEDRCNPDKVENEGPFYCNRKNAWLGNGYYFWDTLKQNAEWWGITNYKNGYVICQAVCDFDTDKCFDLHGEPEHILKFNDVIRIMKEKQLCNNTTTVSRIISYLKNDLKIFHYEACRVAGIGAKKRESFVCFEIDKPVYLDISPPIQICFYSKKSLNLRNYKIIYPVEYVEGWGV